MQVKDINEQQLNVLLQETYTTTSIHFEKKPSGEGSVSLIPRSMLSLKVRRCHCVACYQIENHLLSRSFYRSFHFLQVLAELPIIVVLMYQLYKQSVHNEVSEFIPLIMSTIALQPSHQQRHSPVCIRRALSYIQKTFTLSILLLPNGLVTVSRYYYN